MYIWSFLVCVFACGTKNGHLIGRRNDVTANMAALAVYMCLAASHLLDTPHSSVWVAQVQRALAQKFTVIIWYEGAALAISTWVFLFHCLGALDVSLLGCWKPSLNREVSYCAESLLGFGTALLAKERHDHAASVFCLGKYHLIQPLQEVYIYITYL